MRFALIGAAALLVTACSETGGTGAVAATGDTAVRYVLCSAGESNCFVAARFKTLDSCEYYKKWSAMLCDSSTPGRMECKADPGTQLAFSYCIP